MSVFHVFTRNWKRKKGGEIGNGGKEEENRLARELTTQRQEKDGETTQLAQSGFKEKKEGDDCREKGGGGEDRLFLSKEDCTVCRLIMARKKGYI